MEWAGREVLVAMRKRFCWVTWMGKGFPDPHLPIQPGERIAFTRSPPQRLYGSGIRILPDLPSVPYQYLFTIFTLRSANRRDCWRGHRKEEACHVERIKPDWVS